MYANTETDDWRKWFRQYDRTSIDESGKIKVYSNQMEEMYQAFKSRMREDTVLNIFGPKDTVQPSIDKIEAVG